MRSKEGQMMYGMRADRLKYKVKQKLPSFFKKKKLRECEKISRMGTFLVVVVVVVTHNLERKEKRIN